MSMIEVYDDLRASPRYSFEVLGVSMFKSRRDPRKVKTISQHDGPVSTTALETPVGTLQRVTRFGYPLEHLVKGPQDMKVMKYILDQTEFRFDPDVFELADRAFGERGVVQTFFARAPLQRLILSYMGHESTIYALTDYPHETHDFLRAIEAWDDQMYEVVGDSPVEILSFAENIDAS